MKKNFINSITIFIDIFLLMSIFYFTKYISIKFNIPYISISHEYLLVTIITIIIMFYEKIYILRYDFWQETYKVLKSFFLSYLIVLVFFTLQKTSLNYSIIFISLYFLLAMLLFPISKRFVKKILYSFIFFRKKIFIVGEQNEIDILKKEFKENWYLGLLPSKKNYDMVIISSKAFELQKLNTEIEKYMDKTDEVYVVPYVKNINFVNSNIMEYFNIRYNTIQIQNKLLIKKNIWIKNGFDMFIAFMILPFFLILHIFIAIAIKSDSKGSIFFKQKRLGKNGKIFLCYKYRTMYENSEDILNNYLQNHPEEIEYYKKFHKYQNDPRITKIGKFLRTTSLDELAQVINIFKLEMSLVGPRPYMLNESDKLGADKHFILKVKPGITGLWQVSGRNNLTFKERNELEVWYIKNWSLWNDFVIMIKTIKVVFTKVGVK